MNLETVAKKIKSAVSSARSAPLVVAADVMELARNWKAFQEEAEGASCTTWLQSVGGKGKGLAWWQVRHEAVKYLGEACRRTTDHEVAVWLKNHVPPEYVRQTMAEVRRAQRENNGVEITLAQAKPLIYAIIGKTRKKKEKCARCRLLENILRTHGIEIPK